MENINCRNKLTGIAEAFILMIILQGILDFALWLVSPHFPATLFNKQMITMPIMIVLTIIIICYAKLRKQTLSVLPKKFSKWYIISTCVVIGLYIATPSNYTEGFTSVMTIIYGSIVTPVFEELLFRGYIWNRFSKAVTNELHIYVWNIILFTAWHLLYIMPNFISGDWNPAILLKLVAGLGYGIILGFIRMKTKNCWSTILAHGTLNLFMI